MRGNFAGTVDVLYGELECPGGQWTSVQHQTMVRERIAQICLTGVALGAMLEMDECDDGPDDCLVCNGLRDIFDQCQLDGSCSYCSTWLQHVTSVSDAPTVTPLRIQPPEDWDEWNDSRGDLNITSTGCTLSWVALLLAFLGLPFYIIT